MRPVVVLVMVLCVIAPTAHAQEATAPPGAAADLVPYTETIPETLVQFEMIPVPGGTVTYVADGDTITTDVAPFYIGKTELTWDAYDVFAYKFDEITEVGDDFIVHPSKPYGAPDRGYGHKGFATISVTFEAARMFTRWLSVKTGTPYRLATEAEWVHACQMGLQEDIPLDARAWSWDNAFDAAQAVATKQPNDLGLYDMIGNVTEWVFATDSTGAVRGGSFMDKEVGCDARATYDIKWQETDPQIPKSLWWLSDGGFVGFRLVRDVLDPTSESAP